MNLTMDGLKEAFSNAKNVESNFVAVKIQMDGFPEPEIIVNPNENIDSKLEYYKKTYDENCNHKFAPGIKIVEVAFGCDWETIFDYFDELSE